MIVCGKCGSPIQGTPCHGTLYYRCGNRHRTFPEASECSAGSVKAEPLENAVWQTICDAIDNPQLIAKQIERLKKRATGGQAALRKRLESLSREIAGTDQEENRLLDAYREKVISMDQLGGQMEKVQDKRRHLNEERQALVADLGKGVPDGLDKDGITEYCRKIRSRLRGLCGDFEGKRRILGLLVNKIVLEGKTARITGVIPAIPPPKGPELGQDPCRIASLSSGC
jgi:hypothetical protein